MPKHEPIVHGMPRISRQPPPPADIPWFLDFHYRSSSSPVSGIHPYGHPMLPWHESTCGLVSHLPATPYLYFLLMSYQSVTHTPSSIPRLRLPCSSRHPATRTRCPSRPLHARNPRYASRSIPVLYLPVLTYPDGILFWKSLPRSSPPKRY